MSLSNYTVAQPTAVSTATPMAPANKSYASQANAYYCVKTNNCISLSKRYADVIGAMPVHEQSFLKQMINNSVAEFKRQNVLIKVWGDLKLAQAIYVDLSDIYIDTTMQRQLDLYWVARLLAKFKSTKVVPIQVYVDNQGRLCAWDGQHTAILLWIICTVVMGLDPKDVKIPVNIYPSSKKSEMRECFLDLNSSEGKKSLDPIDHWQQQVFGVRVDGSQNPLWLLTEKKQCILEQYDLFVTHEKFNDYDMPGAISRLQEVNKLGIEPLTWLCKYLKLVTNGARPVGEKEMVMMSHFFLRCYADGLKPSDAYIQQLAAVAITHWNADFDPSGPFWNQVSIAYDNWHQNNPMNAMVNPRVSKEPLHGFPFLLAQLAKSMSGSGLPRNTSNSNFWPLQGDLF